MDKRITKYLEFQEIIKELIENENVKDMKNYTQHFNTNCY